MIHLAKKHRFLLSILSGILMAIAFPYSGSLTPVVFVAWVPLLFIESYIISKNYRSGKVFIHAFITFFLYNLISTWWVYNASGGGAALAIILNSLFMALVFYFFHLTKKHIGSKEGYISLLIYWIAFEYFHYNWEMSWTWLTLGNTFSIVPSWVQWYSYSGALGGTFWILTINLLIYRMYQNVLLKGESWRIQTPYVILVSLFFLIPMVISHVMYFTYTETNNPVEIVIVQPNIDPYNEKFERNTFDGQLNTIISLAKSKATKNTKLIVAPETAFSPPFAVHENELEEYAFYKYFVSEKEKLFNIPWYIGASTVNVFKNKNSRASIPLIGESGYYERYNTSLLIDTDNHAHIVHKSKLVPGVEVIPFSDYLPFLEEWSIDAGGISGTLGIEKEPKILATEKINFAPVVCYESIYGEWVAEQCRKGAELICVATNDGWWKDTPGYKQHLSFSSLRAIENRRCVVRSANTGTSCFINQKGEIRQATKWWEQAVIKDEVNLNSEITFYTTYGDVIGRSFGFVSVLLLLFTFVKRFKNKYIASR